MQLYNPDAEIGNPDGTIFAAGLDTVFLRNIDGIEAAMRSVDADIVSARCPSRGGFNSQVFMIRRNSEGARREGVASQPC